MAAFGTTELGGAQPLSGGLSGAGLWRIRVGGIAYVLKIEETRDVIRDPARTYACMRTAAAAFLGGHWARQSMVYAVLAALPTWIAMRRARAHGW